MAIPYESVIGTAAARVGVPAWLLAAVARRESSFNPNVQTWEPAVNEYSFGLFGLLESTARGLGYTGPAAGLKDPAVNAHWAAELARRIVDRQGGVFPESFYSEWNSGSATAWLSRADVARRVGLFMEDVSWAAGAIVEAGATVSPVLLLGLLYVAYRFWK